MRAAISGGGGHMLRLECSIPAHTASSYDACHRSLTSSSSSLHSAPLCEGNTSSPADPTRAVREMLGVLADWGMSGSVYDVNYDDIVDVSDVLEVLQSWGECG